MKTLFLSAAAVSVASILLGCSIAESGYNYQSDSRDKSVIPAIGEIPKRVELNQSWSPETRMNFWFTSQGARIIPYTWFTWLEQADSQDYFRSAEHMEMLRYLPESASPRNPAGLPIGFALDQDNKSGEAWVGLTCAACHTNQIDYNGTKILIEGAPTLGNFTLFYSRLVDALNATSQEDAKFVRFARNVLASQYSEHNALALRQNLKDMALKTSERRAVNALPQEYPGDFTSYARLDAFGNIQNAGSAFALHNLANGNTPTAPVSYPFLWGTHQSDVVQWNASAPNTPVIGPLVRNMGEVVGVFGGLDIEKAPFWERLLGKKTRYSSTINMKALGHLESWVRDLRSPVWPEQYLPAINSNKAAHGAQLYAQECASCHQLIPRDQEGEKYVSVKTPVSVIGTDPETAWNAEHHMAKSLILEGAKSKILIGERFAETTPAIEIPVNGVVGLLLKDPVIALEAGLIPMKWGEKKIKNMAESKPLEEHLSEHLKARAVIQESKKSTLTSQKGTARDFSGLVYKARPLNGIWATAPYMHNGSIPNLWEVLQKPDQRKTEFWVGSRELDPLNVGFKTDVGLSKFRVLNNTGHIQPGNSNRGHDFGTDLNVVQKRALIEYMKTI